MSVCCLCYSLCKSKDYKIIIDEFGENTKVYQILVKFFDPMILTEEDGTAGVGGQLQSSKIKVVCLECWTHINNFHLFQQLIYKTRTLQQNVISKSLEEKQDDLCTEMQYELSCVGDGENYDDEMDAKVDNLKSVQVENMLEIKNKDLGEELQKTNMTPIQSLNKRKVKTKSKKVRKAIDILLEHTDTTPKTHSNKNVTKASSRAVYTLEKGKESDSFITQWKPNLECDLCSATAPNFDELRCHFREVHATRFYIKCCDRKFYRRCILVDHIKLHVNPDTHKCEMCGKSSTSKYNLKLHKQIVHNEKREYECEVCHKNFNHKPSLERHLLTHATGDKQFFCKECDKGYVLEVQLNTHMRNVHNGIRICEQCGKTFHSVGALKKHLMEHGGQWPKFPCDTCEVILKSNEALKRHKAAYHHDGKTAYVCSVCGKVAASEHALLSHKKFVHEDKRKHKCTFCDKAFRTRIVLREHIATHTGEELYQCLHCPQTFKTNANLHHHRKKIHPVEWKEGRKKRLNLPKVNVDQLKRQVIL